MCIDSSVFEANFVDEFSVFIHVPCVLEKYILVYAVHSIRFDLLFVWVISSVFLIDA